MVFCSAVTVLPAFYLERLAEPKNDLLTQCRSDLVMRRALTARVWEFDVLVSTGPLLGEAWRLQTPLLKQQRCGQGDPSALAATDAAEWLALSK